MTKLRNKKTGETRIFYCLHPTIPDGSVILGLLDDNNSSEVQTFVYNSLAEFKDEWEDYKPVEPLIKDEKVQKAIRAFCEVTQEKKRIFVTKQFGRGSAEFSVGGRYAIRLPLSYESMDALEDGRNYTLTELCGEEE